jgi:hypothetical protein
MKNQYFYVLFFMNLSEQRRNFCGAESRKSLIAEEVWTPFEMILNNIIRENVLKFLFL